MDLNKIKEYAKGYEKDMTAFLRAIVKNPGESCDTRQRQRSVDVEYLTSVAVSYLVYTEQRS